MGLLSDMGPIMPFEKGHQCQQCLKQIAIRQFLHILEKYRTWKKPSGINQIKWGEEIEGSFIEFDKNGSLRLSRGNVTEDYAGLDFPLMFEYGSYMFEMTPAKPYSTQFNLDEIIRSIRNKYKVLQEKSKMPLTIPNIPFLGVRYPETETKQDPFINEVTQSRYIPDSYMASHPRFPTLTKHIRMRRKHTVDIRVPLMIDEKTDLKQIREETDEPYDGDIYLDAMCFGMGMSCLQCTFSTKSLDHARYVYDQLNVLSPLFLAITAGTPFYKGKVSDWDARWNIISGSVDDRPEEERDPQNPKYIPDSRYSSTNFYIANTENNLPQYNDYDLKITQEEIERIRSASKKLGIEIDDFLIKHIANIMKRDILIVHQKFSQMSDKENTLFEMLNGTNWNSVRLKIPIDDEIGWRVEFRTMEVQLTADENAAYSLMIHLFTRVLHQNSDFNLYIPITKLRENFKRAHKKDALLTEKFYFRTNVFQNGAPVIEELSIHEIMFGNKSFEGIYNLFMSRLPKCVKMCSKVKILTASIEKFLHDTTSGKRKTLAQWMRSYVNNDKRYLRNSILPKPLMDDMLIELYEISKGTKKDPNFEPVFNLWDVVENPQIEAECRNLAKKREEEEKRLSEEQKTEPDSR